MIKTWNTILDEKTRHSHVLADRQEQKLQSPYTVQGELLMMPGDTSLGASLSNIINCRCCSITSFEGDLAPIMSNEHIIYRFD